MDPSRSIPQDTFEQPEESKLGRKIRESPFMVAGLGGLVGIVGYNLYQLKNKPKEVPLSLYLIHMRVGAQGFVVSCLTLGVCYQMYKEHLRPKIEKWREASHPK
ncbi:HIG1 domain family member 1C-like [Pollicipes pollicipes]|uniref:HIG1 domain family member 1C-like n=1 Tax=Pollicipes pollicipes TaxID=41117 RepID=UPI0018856F3C|nr:HIG1 domain family member 1C-like [Pollicipes pollicipes]